ncbi:MAG: O-antigen ligase family protein [Ignavibacteriae bacterium]|nr:O-antigen ligase family protein [Ignavibacteriota bacterium]
MQLNKIFLTNSLVFSGLLFSTARMIRGTDNLYIVAVLSFVGIWILNYKTFWDLQLKHSLLWFLPCGIWAVVSTFWSLEPFVSFSRGLFYIFISMTALLIALLYKSKLSDLFRIFFILNSAFVVLSFLSLISGIPSDGWTANHGLGFTSIFLHQNTLAAVLMFTLIGPAYFLLDNMDLVKSQKSKVKSEKAEGNKNMDSRFRKNDNINSNPNVDFLKDLKEDDDIHQHDNNKTRHSELDSESKRNKNLDSCFHGNYNTKDSVIHADRQARSAGIKPESKTDAEQKHFSMTEQRFIILKLFKRESIVYFIIILSNLYLIYLSYSRAVMLALFIGGLAFIYLLGTIKFNVIFTIALLLVGTSIFFLFNENITKYLKKSGPDYFARRNILWEPSYQAALNGGIFGLGYGVTDPTIKSNYKKENKFGELKREKGNSIFALIEEVGIIGLVLFILPLGKAIASSIISFKKSVISLHSAVSNKSSVKNNPSLITHHSSLENQVSDSRISNLPNFISSQRFYVYTSQLLILSFVLAFLIHSQFEGWWTGISGLPLLLFLIFTNLLTFYKIHYE